MNTIRRIEKPWGYEEWWALTEKYVGKILFISHNHRLSLQYHNVKAESVRVLEGILTLTLGENIIEMHPGQSIDIIPGTIHRMEARHGDVTVVEVSTPEVDDVVRVQDDYKRI